MFHDKDGVVTFPLPNRTATGFTFTVILTGSEESKRDGTGYIDGSKHDTTT